MNVRVTTSWDDGHFLDLKLARLLKRYGVAGTFYVSPKNHECGSKERLDNRQIKRLARDFEIGAHTMTHPRLTRLTPSDAREEMAASRTYLERVIGSPVTSVCYPYGDVNQSVADAARELGFAYGRGVKRFDFDMNDPFQADTTVHAYRHLSDAWQVLRAARYNPVTFMRYMRDWSELAIHMFDQARILGGDFHLWGHSWEIEAGNDWDKLERVLKHINAHKKDVTMMKNSQLATPKLRPALIVTPHFAPTVGGLERYAEEMALGLIRAGYDVHVLTTSLSKNSETTSYKGITLHRLPVAVTLSNTPVNIRWLWQVRRLIRDLRPVVINAHMPVPGISDIAVLMAGTVPTAITYHSGSMKKRSFFMDRAIDLYEKLVLPYVLGRASIIISSSEATRQGFLRRVAGKTVTITPGVDVASFPRRVDHVAGREILFIGNFSYSWKGLKYLIEAMDRLPGAHLTVIGRGSQVPHPAVTYRGIVQGLELAAAMQLADVVVLPSISESESFGMVLAEAMSSGVPVVGSRIGGIPLLIRDGENGLLATPRDPLSLAEAIERLLSDPLHAATMGDHGAGYIRQLFRWDQKVAELTDVLDSLIAGEQPSVTPLVKSTTAEDPS